jgi:septation ring formation regulator EzrA
MEMIRINAKIRKEDREFLRDNNIGITELITSAIFQRKNEIQGLSRTFEQERINREKFQRKFSKALRFMEEKGLIDKWIEEDNKPEKKMEASINE